MGNAGALRLFDQLAEEQRQQLTDRFAERHKTFADCTTAMRETIRTLQQRGWQIHENIWTACLFVNWVAHDLSILIFDLAYERDEWRRRFIARSIALVLYEIAEDIPAVLGKNFQEALTILAVPDKLQANLRSAQKVVTNFWSSNRKLLNEIRVVSAAHRDHDAMTQLDVIDQIDPLEILRLGLELGNSLNILGAQAQAIITQTSNTRPPEG